MSSRRETRRGVVPTWGAARGDPNSERRHCRHARQLDRTHRRERLGRSARVGGPAERHRRRPSHAAPAAASDGRDRGRPRRRRAPGGPWRLGALAATRRRPHRPAAVDVRRPAQPAARSPSQGVARPGRAQSRRGRRARGRDGERRGETGRDGERRPTCVAGSKSVARPSRRANRRRSRPISTVTPTRRPPSGSASRETPSATASAERSDACRRTRPRR